MNLWGLLGLKVRPQGLCGCVGLGVGVGLMMASSAVALAGPPFQTDDPDPVAYHHFEMYAFELSDSTTVGGTSAEAPCYEVNWGAVPNVQFHMVLPLVAFVAPDHGPVTYGIGDTELGVKLRFVKETKHRPEVGIFPFVELPSGNAVRGLGVGSTWYRMPLFVQKSWGEWTSYGGGGELIVKEPGYKDYPFAGWLVQRQVNKKLMLGTELFGHGAEGEAALSTRSSTMADLGGSYEFKSGFDVLFAAGRSVVGQPETYTYLALYWTWGPNGKGDGDDTDGGKPGLMAMLTKMRLR